MPLDSEASEITPTEIQSDYAERCLAAPEVGPCKASMRHYHYDGAAGGCRVFIYGGCQGNRNNYDTEESCMAACTVSVLPSSRKSSADDMSKVSTQYKEACVVGSDPGPCRASFPMFYFDHATQSCQGFTYGGCKGNQNRYSSASECSARCSGGQDHFEEHGDHKEPSHWWPGFFLIFTLAAISALLLATLILMVVRRVRRQRRTSQSDKEELLTSRLPSYERLPETESPEGAVA